MPEPQAIRYVVGHRPSLSRSRSGDYYAWTAAPGPAQTIPLLVCAPVTLEYEPGTGRVLNNVAKLIERGDLRVTCRGAV